MESSKLSNLRTEHACAVAVSLRGLSHEKHGEPMQDYHVIRTLPDGKILAVVCDGVGSEKNADIGAKLAAESFSDFVEHFWGYFQNQDSILNLMRTACIHAVGNIKKTAKQHAQDIHSYSTTLHAVIFASGIVYFVHAGDGAIIVMTEDGDLINVTEPQKGEDGQSVIPLLAGPKNWQLGCFSVKVQSVLLCTDGVGDRIAGKILRREECGLDRPIAAYFLSPWAFDYDGDLDQIATELQESFRSKTSASIFHRITKAIAQGKPILDVEIFAEKNYAGDLGRSIKAMQEIQDDISIAIIQRTDNYPTNKPTEWYRPPDWDTINKRIYEILYGGS